MPRVNYFSPILMSSPEAEKSEKGFVENVN